MTKKGLSVDAVRRRSVVESWYQESALAPGGPSPARPGLRMSTPLRRGTWGIALGFYKRLHVFDDLENVIKYRPFVNVISPK